MYWVLKRVWTWMWMGRSTLPIPFAVLTTSLYVKIVNLMDAIFDISLGVQELDGPTASDAPWSDSFVAGIGLLSKCVLEVLFVMSPSEHADDHTLSTSHHPAGSSTRQLSPRSHKQSK